LSIGASLIASLLLSEPKSIFGFIVVVAIIVGSLIAGIILLLLWRPATVIEATIEERADNR